MRKPPVVPETKCKPRAKPAARTRLSTRGMGKNLMKQQEELVFPGSASRLGFSKACQQWGDSPQGVGRFASLHMGGVTPVGPVGRASRQPRPESPPHTQTPTMAFRVHGNHHRTRDRPTLHGQTTPQPATTTQPPPRSPPSFPRARVRRQRRQAGGEDAPHGARPVRPRGHHPLPQQPAGRVARQAAGGMPRRGPA